VAQLKKRYADALTQTADNIRDQVRGMSASERQSQNAPEFPAHPQFL
jgi:hypothetical protein